MFARYDYIGHSKVFLDSQDHLVLPVLPDEVAQDRPERKVPEEIPVQLAFPDAMEIPEKMAKTVQLVLKVLQVCEVHLVVMVSMVLTVLKGNREIEENLVLRDSMGTVWLGRQQITKSGWTLIYNHVQDFYYN